MKYSNVDLREIKKS